MKKKLYLCSRISENPMHSMKKNVVIKAFDASEECNN